MGNRKAAVRGCTKRLSKKAVLEGAMKHGSKDVIVVTSFPRDGEPYLATSMPCASSQDLTANIVLLEDALKRLRRYRRNQLQIEQLATGERP